MSDFTSTTTLTAAVNKLLACAGEQPIEDANDETSLLASLARNTIVEVHKQVLAKGWQFNTEDDFVFTPDVDGKITVPADIIEVDTDSYHNDLEPVMRGRELYSRKNRSFVWDGDVECSIVRLLEWDELPEQARNYITTRAARVFVSRHVGDTASYQYTAADENLAYADMRRFEIRSRDYNIFTNSDVARILDRRA